MLDAHLDRVERVNPAVNAIVTLAVEHARRPARRAQGLDRSLRNAAHGAGRGAADAGAQPARPAPPAVVGGVTVVSQVPPFDVRLPYPPEVAGVPSGTYLDWMRSCWSISATGLPAASVRFGFTADGPPRVTSPSRRTCRARTNPPGCAR
ncbi:hypothetical protein ABZ816_26225 [Actinosynnema sp. NPDC047251]|uniref:hypothetical protein n=1 Tax=Saccharothrix espanaensis TaxID=103731 RepID=UPI002F9176CF